MSKSLLTLHIGHPKAGSTSLQSFLFKNWEALAKQNIHMPTHNVKVSSAAQKPGNPLQTLQTFKQDKNNRPIRAWIENSLTHHKEPRLLLSSEVLFNVGFPKLFTELSDIIDLHIIYYVRRQDKLLLSAWKQWALKKGWSLDQLINKRLETGMPNFIGTTERWLAANPGTSFYVRFIEEQFLAEGDLITDFCKHLQVNPTGMKFSTEQMNPSPDGRILSYLSKHPELFSSVDDNTALNTLTNACSIPEKIPYQLTEDQFDKIYEYFEPQNQELLKKFHSEMAGETVIEKTSAPIWQRTNGFSSEEEEEIIPYALTQQLFGSHT